jgi:hypothetical protein
MRRVAKTTLLFAALTDCGTSPGDLACDHLARAQCNQLDQCTGGFELATESPSEPIKSCRP